MISSLKTPLKFSFTKWSLWWDFPALTLSSLLFRQLVVLFACRTFIKNERHLISSKMSHFTAHPQEKLWVSQGRGVASGTFDFSPSFAKTDLSALHCICCYCCCCYCHCLRRLKAFRIAPFRYIRPPVWHVPPPWPPTKNVNTQRCWRISR